MIGRILFCGDRNWNDYHTIREVISQLVSQYGDEIAIIHGAARGADHMAGQAALAEELTVWSEPAKWAKHGKAAGPIRNVLMCSRYKPHLVIAIHADLSSSKGTKSMVDTARIAGVPVICIASRKDAENIQDELPESLCSETSET